MCCLERRGLRPRARCSSGARAAPVRPVRAVGRTRRTGSGTVRQLREDCGIMRASATPHRPEGNPHEDGQGLRTRHAPRRDHSARPPASYLAAPRERPVAPRGLPRRQDARGPGLRTGLGHGGPGGHRRPDRPCDRCGPLAPIPGRRRGEGTGAGTLERRVPRSGPRHAVGAGDGRGRYLDALGVLVRARATRRAGACGRDAEARWRDGDPRVRGLPHVAAVAPAHGVRGVRARGDGVVDRERR